MGLSDQSPLYDCVMKCATLDILEQNVARMISQDLEEISPEVQALNLGIKSFEDAAKQREVSMTEMDLALAANCNKQFGNENEPLPPMVLALWSMVSIYGSG